MFPDSVLTLIAAAPAVGFSGSRVPAPGAPETIAAVAPLVAPSTEVLVGCQRGIDEIARSYFPGAIVFRASDFGVGKGSFAARSAACVRAVAAAGGLWLSFPSSPCPSGLFPSSSSSRCFGGFASGSWSSLALALGLGVPCLVWLPPSIPCPVGWGLSAVGAGWWVFVPASRQLSLF